MRKLIKKIAVCACAVAFAAAGILAGKATTVKAAEVGKTKHILVKGAPEGTTQIGINAWGGAWVDTKDWPNLKDVTTALTSWGCTPSMVNVRIPQCSSAFSEPNT